MAWTMLWPFFDKVFGLGFATTPEKSWLRGGSPTLRYLQSATGPFESLFQAMAGHPLVDALFMIGLFCTGLALFLGIGLRIAGYAGALMMLLMWMSHLPLQQNPLIDEHIVYALVFLALGSGSTGSLPCLQQWWRGTALVRRFPILQ